MYVSEDTIVAISTASGAAARAIVRVSGSSAIEAAEAVFLDAEGIGLDGRGGFAAADGRVRLRGRLELPARAYVFRAPRSYTREDLVELHLPASAAALLAETLCRPPLRAAEAGEFTARAYLNGRLDLAEAQAVADVIAAADAAQLRAAEAVLRGGLGDFCRHAADTLLDALAGIEAELDLAETEDLPVCDVPAVRGRLSALGGELEAFALSAADAPPPGSRPSVALAGRPNAGKSSLLNALSGVDRAIVSAMAGTTRDVLSAPVVLAAGRRCDCQDLAGLDLALPAATADALESCAHAAALSACEAADLVCFVTDLSRPAPRLDGYWLRWLIGRRRPGELMIVANQLDRLDDTQRRQALEDLRRLAGEVCGSECGLHAVSARTGEGLDELRAVLAERLDLKTPRPGEALMLHGRQRRAFLAAAEAAGRAADLLGSAAELAAAEVRLALEALGEVTGSTAEGRRREDTEEVLGRIFSRFCVGK